MSFDDDFSELLVEAESDCEDSEYDLGFKNKKQKVVHSFMVKVRQSCRI